MKSSPRNGATVRLLGIHTTEGILSAVALRQFFDRPNAAGSSHAGADSTGLLLDGDAGGYVSPDRAAWTLRDGNPVSENLELCAWAHWTRDEWLARPKLLTAAATWIARRAKARGLPLDKLSPAQVARGRGVIGHIDWTEGMNDGTHWDPGPDFPWDVVMAEAVAIFTGTAPTPQLQQEDDMALVFITDGPQSPWWAYDGYRRRYVGPGEPQLLVDLGLARENMVKLIAPATLAAIPTDVPVDEQAIGAAVTQRWARMDAEQRAKEAAHVLAGLDA